MKNISKEKYLIDTNVLVYSLDKTASLYKEAHFIIKEGIQKHALFVVAEQNLLELTHVLIKVYNVSPKEAAKDANTFAQSFEVIAPLPKTWHTFTQLIEKNERVNDLFNIFLIATMLDNGVERIITANSKDFQNLGLLEVIPLVD